MEVMADTSVWIDFLRPRTSVDVRRKAGLVINDPDTVLCEPVYYELLRSAPVKHRRKLTSLLDTFTVIETPETLWRDATLLGQKCLDKGRQLRPLDLLIAQICIHHDLLLVAFDRDFESIAEVAPLHLQRLNR